MINLKKIQHIGTYEPLQQRFEFDNEAWLRYDYGNEEVNQMVASICADYPHGLSRCEIINAMKGSQEATLKGFIMTVMFCCGTQHRWQRRMKFQIANLENLLGYLGLIDAHLANNDIYEAHRLLTKISLVGQNIVTRYLYFRGRAMGMEKYPLILTKRIATSILVFNSADLDYTTFINATPKADSRSYCSYVGLLHNLAATGWDTPIQAEQLEFYLERDFR